MEAQILQDIELFLTTIPADVSSAMAIIAAWKSQDQASLDALHAAALSLANDEAPSGQTPLA
jgi:hypothetical protein